MRQPKPDSMDYPELLGQVEAGSIKIPDFQRPVVWDIAQTLYLLDSIARGFPIGSLIFWHTNEPMKSHRNVGNLPLREPPEGRAVSYVLDGQQRLTSLFASLKGATISGKPYRVFCDLDSTSEEDVFSLDRPDSGRFVDLKDVLGDDPQLAYDNLSKDRKKRFNQIREAFRLYKFSVIRIENQTLDTVCEIFTRINNSGTELDLFDLMVAKTWTTDFNLRDRYDDLVGELETGRYEGLGQSAVIQAAACIIRNGCTRKLTLSIRREEMASAWPGIEQSIRLSVDFLRNKVGVPSWRLLPYQSVLAPIAYFFHKNQFKQPDAKQARYLSRYFWRASLTERYSSATESKIGYDLKDIDRLFEHGEVEETLFTYPIALNDDDLIRCQLSLGNAFCKTVLAFLASTRPLNLENNGVVSVDNSNLARSNSRHFHHFFPRKHLRVKGVPQERADSVVNICLVPAESNLHYSDSAPREYLEPLKRSNSALPSALETHLIGEWKEFGILEDDYDKFLDRRSAAIREGLERHFLTYGEFDTFYGAGNEDFPSDSRD
jgi:hypothetical protein